MLIVFAGLPGTGKSTLARLLAARLGAVLLRIDGIEQALRDGGVRDVGPGGYLAAYSLASANLDLGHTVVADCVNPVPETRAAWREVADRAGQPILNVELRCSDRAEHRRRLETRIADIPNLVLPTWEQVLARDYAPWCETRMEIDTSRTDAAHAVSLVVEEIGRARGDRSATLPSGGQSGLTPDTMVGATGIEPVTPPV